MGCFLPNLLVLFTHTSFGWFCVVFFFFFLLQGAGMKGFLKEGIAGAYIVQRLTQIACQSIGFNGQERQIGERGWLGHLLGSS